MKPESKQFQALLQKKAELIAKGKAIFDKAETEARDLTAEELAQDDALNAELNAVNIQLKSHEARRERERDGVGVPMVNKLPLGDSENKALAHYFRSGDRGAVSHLVRADEGGKLSVTLNIPTVAEMMAAARYSAAVVDSTMNITTAADGANIVPTGFVRDVATRKNEIMLAARLGLRRVPGQGTTVNYPVEGADPEVFAATAEQADNHSVAYERDAGVTNLKAFTLAKKTRKIELTEEILEDNDVNLNAYISDRIGRQIAKTHNTMLITEVAANGTALKTFAAAAAIAAGEPDAIVFNDALSYYLADGSSPAWVMRPSTFGAIASLTGNPRVYAETPQGKLQRQLLNYAVEYSQAVAAPAASAKSVYFGDWDNVGYREAPDLRFIMDPYSVDGLVILKYSFRAVYGVLQAAAVGYGVHPTA